MLTIDANVLPFAGIMDLLTFLVPLVFFVIYALNQLLAAKANQQPKGNPPQRRPNQPRAERPMRPPQPPEPQGGAAQLNAEIEQFLKRASQRRGERPARERAARTQPPPKAPQRSPARTPRSATPPAPLREEPVDVEPVETRDFDAVAASVEQHIGRRDFTQRTEHLADDIVRADQQMEAHLHEAFDHRVGTLPDQASRQGEARATDTGTEAQRAAPAAAAALVEILRTPQGMRQAIVLGEILARPVERW
ncbi:MAG: hypothetical protein AB7O59_14440 [Pirellulales bacterium]